MDDFQNILLNAVGKKLQRLIEDVDDKNRGKIRALWQNITPAPDCMHSTVLCERLQEIIGPTYAARAGLAADVICADLSEAPHSVIVEIRKPLMKLVEHLLAEPYHPLISSTPSVYERKGAPSGKFLQSSFEHTLALIRVTAINATHRGLRDIDAVFEEAALKAQLREMRSSAVKAISVNIVDSTIGVVQTGANAVSMISQSNYPSIHDAEWSKYE